MPAEKIYRSDFVQANPTASLVTVQEFAQRNGTTLSVMRAAISRYADQVPGPVKLVNGRTKYYAEEELAEFYKNVTGRTSPRSPLEVARSEMARLKMTILDTEERVENRKEELEKAERDLRRFRKQLQLVEERVSLEEQNEADKARSRR